MEVLRACSVGVCQCGRLVGAYPVRCCVRSLGGCGVVVLLLLRWSVWVWAPRLLWATQCCEGGAVPRPRASTAWLGQRAHPSGVAQPTRATSQTLPASNRARCRHRTQQPHHHRSRRQQQRRPQPGLELPFGGWRRPVLSHGGHPPLAATRSLPTARFWWCYPRSGARVARCGRWPLLAVRCPCGALCGNMPRARTHLRPVERSVCALRCGLLGYASPPHCRMSGMCEPLSLFSPRRGMCAPLSLFSPRRASLRGPVVVCAPRRLVEPSPRL